MPRQRAGWRPGLPRRAAGSRRWGGELLALSAPIAAGVALAGCGGGDPIARAAQVSAAAPGYTIALTETITTAALSAPISATGTGSINEREHSGTLRFDFDLGGTSGPSTLRFDAVFAGVSFYLRLPSALARQNPGGRPWLRIDRSASAGAVGRLSSLAGATSVDPAQLLDYLRAAGGGVRTVGRGHIRGVLTTHYRATVDLARLPALVPAGDRAQAEVGVQALERLTHSSSFPVDAWIDKAGLVRRESFSLALAPTDTATATDVHISADLYGYGPQPAVRIPAKELVYDATSVVSSNLAKQSAGSAPTAAGQASSTLR